MHYNKHRSSIKSGLTNLCRPQAKTSCFNQSQAIDHPLPMVIETLTVIRETVQIYQLTGNALDITMGLQTHLNPLPH